MTPMQIQYEELKRKYKDTILLFRLGDFYEAFNEDAELISKVLGITLTGRGKNENRTPMAGIPYHALPNYMPKLVEAGLKIAIADQMEEAKPGKIVERQVTKIITPGTILDEKSLDSSRNNYIASIYSQEFDKKNQKSKYFALILCDLTTGELKAFTTDNIYILKNELSKFKPAEIIVSENDYKVFEFFEFHFEKVKNTQFLTEENMRVLLKQFGVNSLKGFGIEEENSLHKLIINGAGALVSYLLDCQRGKVEHIKSIRIYSYENYMQIDSETIGNLELLSNINSNDQKNTLFGVLNFCKTPMGQRKLRNWILTPLINPEMLDERLNVTNFFFENRVITSSIQDLLRQLSDIERIVGRIGVGSANPRDMNALKNSLRLIIEIKNNLVNEDIPIRLRSLLSLLSNSETEKEIFEITNLISESIDEDPSVLINQGRIIKTGYNNEVDELRGLKQNSKQILAEIQKREIERTQINNLKISFNNLFGYYIEVSNSHKSKVPNNYIRKQTLANAERYITEELKEVESRILTADEKLINLEMNLFLEIREEISHHSKPLLELGDIIAEIDVLSNFGEISRENRYSKPNIVQDNNDVINIRKGRHPVIEKLVDEFTPNSVALSSKEYINIITGPNMSGKSTYIRQVALICLMAQIGCFVPAESMEFSIIDRIFTRVGAGDNLSKGESTFMVEMSETANILNNATKKSLVILDEVGRGTSTYDGVAIAWSIVEHINSSIKCKTLFATHYHELTDLEEKYEGIKNYNVKVIEENDEILFSHKIVEGSAKRSYGIYVAEIAGVPKEVTKRANEILLRFEKGEEKSEKLNMKNTSKSPPTPKKIHPEQLGLI